MNYCVMRIDSGEVVYKGRSCFSAAMKLEPGTVHGKGIDGYDAQSKANAARRKVLSSVADAGKIMQHKDVRP